MPDFSSPSTPSFDDIVRRCGVLFPRFFPKKALRCSEGANCRDPTEYVNIFFQFHDIHGIRVSLPGCWLRRAVMHALRA